jgi:S-DNA-T family DNA segregation ATPase FtsK/SpoIIIE
MPKRKVGRMARPRSQGKASPAKDTLAPALDVGKRALRWMRGPVGQQLLALALMGFGIVTIVTVAGANSGKLINAWARLLVFMFGWGAYPTAALLTGLGLLWLRHLVHRPTAWRWRPFLGLELTLIGLLTLTQTFISQQGWGLVQSGRGGGVVGWALYVFFHDPLGPLITGVLMGVVTLFGLGLAFDLTRADLAVFGRRLWEVWDAFRARSEARSEARDEAATKQVAHGVVVATDARRRPPAPEPEPAQASQKPKQPSKSAPAKAKAPAAPRDKDLPPLSLLQERQQVGERQKDIRRKSRIIEEALAQFGVPARVTEVRPGPTVTQFGVSPGYISRGSDGEKQRKVRVSQIASLADDLALALAARSLRVQAPVPGRAVVGIEVPNADTSLVSLRAVLDSKQFRRCDAPLCFAVGMDVAGTPIVADLSLMPHLLIAGTTGSGKSVFVKALAASLIMHNAPSELRLVSIDPKMVELTHLNGLPHLLGPTETKIEEVLRVLRWVTQEMDRRYKQFAATVSRNLDDYNRKMRRKDEEMLPRIVVLIDELADLMMSEPEETERSLTRIAQMARATGIHLVVATQRPSTDVVTGLIKANFPARISFATASNTDSRVILDAPGAETLLGRGDMLFLPPDASAPQRVQGCFISEDELEALIQFWQKQAGATPAKPPWEEVAESAGPQTLRIEGQFEDADLLEKAIAVAKQRGKISTSGLQRHLHISYPRAARLMEEMEKMGVVGPQQSAGRKRRVIIGGDGATGGDDTK